MKVLLPILIMSMVFFAGYLLGKYAGSTQGPKLTRPERKELAALRGLKSSVRSTASNHSVLDSNFSQIILDEIEAADKEIDNARNT